MADAPEKSVLLTGAAGNLGRVLARELAAQGWTLRVFLMRSRPTGILFTKVLTARKCRMNWSAA